MIHDPGEIFKQNDSYLKYWNIICIRKSFQEYLINKYDVNPKFLYRPFYAYPTQKNGDNDDNMITKT